MCPTQATMSRIRFLSGLCTLLGLAAMVLYFLSPGYGFSSSYVTPYYWGLVGLDVLSLLLGVVLFRLGQDLPEKARRTLQSYLKGLLLFLAFQIVEDLAIIACEAGVLMLSTSVVRVLEGGRIGDWGAIGLFPYLAKVERGL